MHNARRMARRPIPLLALVLLLLLVESSSRRRRRTMMRMASSFHLPMASRSDRRRRPLPPHVNHPCQRRRRRRSTIPALLQFGSTRGIDDDDVERERRSDSGATRRWGAVDDNDNHDDDDRKFRSRRSFLSALTLTTSSMGAVWWDGLGGGGAPGRVAHARGLIRFPCVLPLSNAYHILRSGCSLLEEEGVWSTNPLFLTNREAALSDVGALQVREACECLKSTSTAMGGIGGGAAIPTIVRYSLAASSVDSANIVGEVLNIGRDRLVPEFNYMDPRAIGGWDYSSLNSTTEAVWALDADEAGKYGRDGRPPSNDDGTPAETLSDQVVRLTNLMSVLETLYSGDTVLLVFPDGTGPALLSCLIGGIPLNRVHELEYRPGEMRCHVTYDAVNEMANRSPPSTYYDSLERGRAELRKLRESPDVQRNVKDLKYEVERELEMKELRRQEEAEEAHRSLGLKRSDGDDERTMRMGDNATQSLLYPVVAGVAMIVSGGLGSNIDMVGIIEGKKTSETDTDDTISPQTLTASAIIPDVTGSILYDPADYYYSTPTGMPECTTDEYGDASSSSDAIQNDAQNYDDAWLDAINDIIYDDEQSQRGF